MKQKELDEQKLSWEKDEAPRDDAEVIKLKVGQSVEGILVDRLESKKYDTFIYKIKVKNDPIVKVILGTTILDKLMKDKELTSFVKIERIADSPSSQGKPLQNWVTYHAKV
jgi:predicted SpoU family rRNA methylase